MSRMSPGRLTAIATRHPPAPSVFVESGTFHGKTTRLALERFRVVHTVELHQEWFWEALKELAPLGAHCHHGNSADVLPKLAKQIQGPVFWYLDAHWFKTVPDVAGQDVPLPLWAELEAIAQRTEHDVIVVDDVHAFGGSNPTAEWKEVSLEKIAGYFPGHKESLVMWDQAVVYR